LLPLNNLVAASERIEQGNLIPRPIPPCRMSWANFPVQPYVGRAALYRSLNTLGAEKTQHLNEAHQQLEMLFKCSQALNTGQIDSHCFPAYFADCA
jgi:two-component system nitrate/nitrite sensor histidine kinase NarQ